MRGYRCDTCTDFCAPTEREYTTFSGTPSTIDRRPAGWVETYVDESERAFHFCSHACAMAYLESRAATIEGVGA